MNDEDAVLPVTPYAPEIKIDPPVGQKKRQAWHSHRGYDYQVWYAIAEGLTLKADEVLFLECAEDVDRTSATEISARQVKAVAASISLNTAQARSALDNFWQLRDANTDRKVFFHFITTGEIVLEQQGDFEKDAPGIVLWKTAKTDLPAAGKIHEFLKSATGLSASLKAFLDANGTEEVQTKLIEPFTWEANALSSNEIEALVEERIFSFADSMDIPADQEDILTIKKDLFFFTSQKSVAESERSLTKREFTDLVRKATSIRVPLAEWRGSRSSRRRVASPHDLPIDWATPSSGLESWPKTLGNGREIERPELAKIIKTINDSSQSAQLLLGEPGLGKSALLAKLSTELSARGVTHLSLKADLLPKELTSLDQLVSGLGARTLLEAIQDAAIKGPFIVLIDQLDAVCSLVDQKTDRLNLLLSFIQQVGAIPKVHLVASCRPFELQTDVRLQGLRAEQIALALPPWEAVAPFVVDENNLPLTVPESTKEVLRNPWHLKLYLDLPQPRPLLNSFYDLVSAVWQEKLSRPGAPARCADLVHIIADRISDTEELWVPDAIADAHPAEKLYLIAEGILKQTENLRQIGFRHQTFYDYFLLRSFLRQGTSLVDYIKAHDQSFFIRPTVIRALVYLRATEPTEFAKVLHDLFTGSYLRPHLRSLVLEFIGQHREPLPEETHHLLPLLNDDVQGQRVLRVISGSPGWFRALFRTNFEEQWINAAPAKAVNTVPVLAAAMNFAEREVVNLLVRHWVGKPAYDRLVFNIFSEARLWEPELITAVGDYAKRCSTDEMWWIFRKLVQQAPAKACPMIGELFRRETEKIIGEVERETSAENNEDPEASLFREKPSITKIKKILHGDRFHHAGIIRVAELRPVEFLHEIWNAAKTLLLLAAAKSDSGRPTDYRHDHIGLKEDRLEERVDDVLLAVERAITQLARNNPGEFLQWTRPEAHTDSITVQRLIAKGLAQLSERDYADTVIRYLSEDQRRLYLGTIRDEFCDTKALLKKFSATCSRGLFCKVSRQIANIPSTAVSLYRPKRSDLHPDKIRRWSRRDRLELLMALPMKRLILRLQRLFHRERKALGDISRHLTEVRGGFVGAPIPLNQMETMDDVAITSVLDKFHDGVDWNEEAQWTDVARSGGGRQQAIEFGRFAIKYPDRAKTQIPLLRPGEHESYAVFLIQKLADPRPENLGANKAQFPPILPPAEIEILVAQFDEKGFSSSEFRVASARALSHVCQAPQGLSEPTIQLLRGWLPLMEDPQADPHEIKTHDAPDGSILFRGDAWWTCPDGRSPIIEAIVEGLLSRQPPSVQECLLFLDEIQKSEHDPGTWSQLLCRLTGLFGMHGARMTALYSDLFTRLPDLFSLTPTAIAWSAVSGLTDPIDQEKVWFDLLLKRQEPYYRQLAGELVFIHYARRKTSWAKALIDQAVNGDYGDYFYRGVVYAAAACMPVQPLNNSVEEILTRALVSGSKLVSEAAQTVVAYIERDGWNASTKRLVMKLIEANSTNANQLDFLCRQLENIFALDPNACLEAAEKIVGRFKGQLADITTSLPLAAEHIINMTLTAQRIPRLRERGLVLFENLLDLNIPEAKKAADLLNERSPLTGR